MSIRYIILSSVLFIIAFIACPSTLKSDDLDFSVAGIERVASLADHSSSSGNGYSSKDIHNFLPSEAMVKDAFFAGNSLQIIWSNGQTTELWKTEYSLEMRQVMHEGRFQESVNEVPKADLESGVVFFDKTEVSLPLYTPNSSIAISPNGRLALYAADEKRTVIAWNLVSLEEQFRLSEITIPELEGFFSCITITFIDDDYAVLTLLNQDHVNATLVLNVSTGEVEFTIPDYGFPVFAGANKVALSSDAKRTSLLLTKEEHKFSANLLDEISEYSEQLTLKYSSNGLFAVTCLEEDSIVFKIYDTTDYQLIKEHCVPKSELRFDIMADFKELSDDGKHLILKNSDGDWFLLE